MTARRLVPNQGTNQRQHRIPGIRLQATHHQP